ncbi:MAG: hypothetical protein LQ343_004329 [Gyalolechia ehrenbergii]|nr:MAG: hypothetical protein LQ343_004329 [Gyalolechia ehrenbergii]
MDLFDLRDRGDQVSFALESAFFLSSSIFIFLTANKVLPFLGWLYLAFLLLCLLNWSKIRPPRGFTMYRYPISIFNFFIYITILLSKTTQAQSPDKDTANIQSAAGATAAPLPSPTTSGVIEISETTTTFRPIFTVPTEADGGESLLPNINDPNATDAQVACPGYIAATVKRTDYGLTATLSLAGPACNVYGTDVEILNLTVEYQSADRLSVRVVPACIDASNSSQFILPTDLVHQPRIDADAESSSLTTDLGFVWSNDPTFSFSVLRKSTGDMLFSTEGTKLVYENQFIEFVSALPGNYNVYGLGETIHGLRLGNNFTKTMWAADVGDPIDLNIYGSHPFYLDTRYYEVDSSTGNLTLVTSSETNATADYIAYSHGVYNRNAHGQEILLRPTNITWRLLGGSIDLYFYAGPTQPDVTTAFQTSAIGLPALQQYFTFGYHQCRWGYANWSQLQEVVDNHERFGIPLENIWTDIDYMNQYRDFDNDLLRYNYTEGETFLSNLHASGRHYIPIIDAAIYVPNPENASDAYVHLQTGYLRAELMIDILPSIEVHPPFKLPGEPGAVIYEYPEGFNLTNATEAASAASASSRQVAASSTASPSSTVPNYLRTTPTPGVRDVNYPPYVINHVQGDLAAHAVSPNATHADGTEEYDVHNLFGSQILNATYNALLAAMPGRRPFIIGRSTFSGAGKWAGHWGGDNYSLWAYMFFSIPQALSFSLFGIPMFGADTCGFNGNSDEELCNRWMQLSAFFPFYRNHNTLTAIPQEAYVWASVAEASRTAMNIRYSILPYMYTLFYLAHSTGSTVMRALAWEFPNDPSLAAADRQFFLGPAILVTPVLVQGATNVSGVFPGAGGLGEVYYDWYTLSAQDIFSPRANVTIDAPLGHIPVYLRGGYVIPTQEPAMTTRDARRNPWGVIAALSLQGTAQGNLYIDDGESVVQENGTLFVEFTASGNALYASARGTWNDTNPLANVTVLGVQDNVSSVSLNGVSVGEGSVRYNDTNKALVVSGLGGLTSGGAWREDWVLRWS